MLRKQLTSRTYILLFLLIILIGAFYYQKNTGHLLLSPRSLAEQQMLKQAMEARDPMKALDVVEFRKRFLLFDGFMQINSSLHQTESWHRTEFNRHITAITSAQYDFIVLPVQESSPTYDRIGRLMSARIISKEIAQRLGKTVMSPELTLRLLGGRAQRFDDEQVNDLAKRVNADMVHLFLGSTFFGEVNKRHLAIVLAKPNGRISKRIIVELDQGPAERPLEMMVAEVTPEIIEELFSPTKASPIKETYRQETAWTLPQYISGLPQLAKSPIEHAAYLQLIALCTPQFLDYERHRLFERSLMALSEVDPSSDHYNLLSARALFHLHRRPSALAYLASASTPAEKALLEYLNGNYPELLAQLPAIDDPLLQAAAYIERYKLHDAYGKPSGTIDDFGAANSGWDELLATVARDEDGWYAPENLSFFIGLNGLFPEFDSLFRSVIGEQAVSGTLDIFSENEDLLDTVFLRAGNGADAPSCCLRYESKIEPSDLWALYRNHAITNNLRHLNLSANVRGSYQTARKLAERLEPRLQGHPSFTLLYAEALAGEAEEKQGIERTYLLKKAIKLARATQTHAAAVNFDTTRAGTIIGTLSHEIPAKDRDQGILDFHTHLFNMVGWDFPSSELFLGLYSFAPTALPYTNSHFRSVMAAFSAGILKDAALEKVLATRFNGHPLKTAFRADRLIESGHQTEAINLLRDAVKAGDDSWEAYSKLGNLLLEQSNYSEASIAFLKYPYFKNPPSGEWVGVSNRAYIAGSRLYWLGHYEEARPLYEIAASLDTGADSQYAASQRLAVPKSDFRTVLTMAYQRGERYNNQNGYRDYLAFLQLLGLHDEAEAGFKSLAPRYTEPQLWTSLFVGQRIKKQSFEDIRAWTKRYIAETGVEHLKTQGQRYGLMQALVDRVPTSKQPKAIKMLNDGAPPHGGMRAQTPLATVFADWHLKADKQASSCPPEIQDCANYGFPAPLYAGNRYAGFLEAYIHLRAGRYGESLHGFLQYDQYQRMLSTYGRGGFALPYLAMAASKASAAKELDGLLLALEEPAKVVNFDRDLTKAVIYAQGGKLDEALTALVDAYNNRPHTEWRPFFTWYQLTETAEWIYQETGDERFLSKALEWAKRYQVIQPQFAWAYAFEARYSKHEKDRIRASGFASYLDPNSKWLSQVPEDIRKRGAAWWKINNPFEKFMNGPGQQEPLQTNSA